MALLFLEGFDHIGNGNNTYATQKWSYTNSWVIGSPGRFGTGSYLAATFGPNIYKNFSSNYQTWIAGIACYTGPNSNKVILTFGDVTTVQVALKWNGPSGLFQLYRGSTLIGTSSQTYAIHAWYYVELKATIANSGGTAEVRVNGVTVISYTGDTQQGANAYVNRLSVENNDIRLDDLYLCDNTGTVWNDFQGDMRIETSFVTGAGNYAQWTPSAGANWQNVDDPDPDGDTTYNYSSTAGQKDSFAHGALAVSGTVKAVQVTGFARKDDAGSRSARLFLRVSLADYPGVTLGLADSYLALRDIWETNPAGGNWNTAAVDAAEPGIELIS